ncbi:MAG: hypothetical protein GXY11_06755 [Clostridiales bacterium]|nr:hypothetical protein [Clostridiales bacterium]
MEGDQGKLSVFSDYYLTCKARVDELNDALKQANAEKDAAEQALVDAMVNAGVTGFKTDDGVGISAVRKAQYSCPAEKRDELYAALRAQGLDYLFSVPAQTLNKFAKDRVEQEGGLDEVLVELLVPYETVGLQVREFKRWKGGGS